MTKPMMVHRGATGKKKAISPTARAELPITQFQLGRAAVEVVGTSSPPVTPAS